MLLKSASSINLLCSNFVRNLKAFRCPFPNFISELSAKVTALEVRSKQFKTLLTTTNTATNDEFKECRRGSRGRIVCFVLLLNLHCCFESSAMSRELKSAEKQMKDLTMTVDFVQRDRAQYAHIDGDHSPFPP